MVVVAWLRLSSIPLYISLLVARDDFALMLPGGDFGSQCIT